MPMLDQPATKYCAFVPVELPDRRWPDQVINRPPLWCSVDLRDGNQSLIEPMDPTRKLKLFEALLRIGFKEIEVGFPAASQADFDFVRLLIERHLIPGDVTIQVLTQARDQLIERSFDALRGAPRAIMHVYNATAPVMRKVVLGLDEDGIVELATRNARLVQACAARQPETDWTLQYSQDVLGHRVGVCKAGGRCGHCSLATHARAQVHHQPAVDRGAQHAQCLCRHDRMDAPPS